MTGAYWERTVGEITTRSAPRPVEHIDTLRTADIPGWTRADMVTFLRMIGEVAFDHLKLKYTFYAHLTVERGNLERAPREYTQDEIATMEFDIFDKLTQLYKSRNPTNIDDLQIEYTIDSKEEKCKLWTYRNQKRMYQGIRTCSRACNAFLIYQPPPSFPDIEILLPVYGKRIAQIEKMKNEE